MFTVFIPLLPVTDNNASQRPPAINPHQIQLCYQLSVKVKKKMVELRILSKIHYNIQGIQIQILNANKKKKIEKRKFFHYYQSSV